jgi:hypothetical protein
MDCNAAGLILLFLLSKFQQFGCISEDPFFSAGFEIAVGKRLTAVTAFNRLLRSNNSEKLSIYPQND